MNTSQLKKYLTPKNTGIAFIVLAIVVIVIISIFFKQKEAPPSAEPPIAEKVVCRPVPGSGKQTYNIKTDRPKTLQITQIDVDPIDVEEGKTQTIRVTVTDKNKNATTSQVSVLANVLTDKKSTPASLFTLTSSENTKGSLLSVWEGSWTRDDDYCSTYMETIIAKNNKDESKIDLSFK